MTPVEPKIHLGALALGIAKTCLHEWSSWAFAPPASAEQLRSLIVGPGGIASESRADIGSWVLLEESKNGLMIGSEEPVFWSFRQTADGDAMARIGVHRAGGTGPWWEVVLEGGWEAATVRQVRVAPFTLDWLKADPRRIGLLGQFYADSKREVGTPWGDALRALIQGIEEWALLSSEANAASLASFAQWDGLAGSGALLRDPLDLEDPEAVARRRAFVDSFRMADDFMSTRIFRGHHGG